MADGAKGSARDGGFGFDVADIAVDMTARDSRTVTESDILVFAGVSGDTNPVHLDEAFAKRTMFGGRIAHGMLGASYISTVIGTKLPGPGCVYLSQNLRFKAPVKIGDTVTTSVTVTAVDPVKRRVTLATICAVGERVVIEGEALIMVPARPAA